MLSKIRIALVAALVVGSAPIALADGEFDPNLGNRYPAYNNPVAARDAVLSAPMALRRNGDKRTQPVRLQTPGYGEPSSRGGEPSSRGGEPSSRGDGHMPRAFYDQEQPGYPQSPPEGGR